MVGDVGECLVEVLRSERLAGDERVQGQGEDPAAVRRVGVELVELVLDDLHEPGSRQAHGESVTA